ncbi:asparaginase [Nakamurella leprariae]
MVEYGQRRQFLPTDEMLARVPELFDIATVEGVTFDRIGVDTMSVDDWCRLHDRITEAVADGADGIVVTHGTNTLEELAWFLHLTLKVTCPVVLVGAMRPASGLSSDGSLNLLNAVRVAAAPESRSRGVLVVMNNQIHEARTVSKTSTTEVQSFSSAVVGPLGLVDMDGQVVFHHRSQYRHTMDSVFRVAAGTPLPRVDIVVSYYGAQPTQIDALVAAGARGIIAAGAGTTGSPVENAALDRAVAAGIVVVQASRVPTGRVTAWHRLAVRGIVASGDHSPWKARVLLMLALTVAVDATEIQKMFLEY